MRVGGQTFAKGLGLQITVDRTACKGAAQCALRAPRTFALDEEDKAVVRDPAGDADDTVIEAARCCPNFAITVILAGERVV